MDDNFNQVKGIKLNSESVLYCNYNSEEFYDNYSKKIILKDVWNAIDIYIKNSLTPDTFSKNTKLVINDINNSRGKNNIFIIRFYENFKYKKFFRKF